MAGIPDAGIYIDQSAPVWSLRPGLDRDVAFVEESTSFSVRTNSLGWRGDEPTTGSILCLGDSTTFGWGVAEDEAWPEQLEALLGADVTNGGVPGYSTFQGLAKLDAALATEPEIVVLGFLVRDAQLAVMADSARPSVGAGDPPLRLMALMARARPAGEPPPGTVPRVPADEYRQNLEILVQWVRSSGAEPVLLAFPMQEPAEAHLAVLRSLTDVRLLAPSLPASSFFPNDPIHLTAEGNAQLAALVADALED
ncbi:MAG: hypothetical protein GY913_26270 [Proteobacteria bacterium]|nr:hypothetical protein [Pseudomonadota bacterium]MCP4920423.1 hypothetical protein [Pseudomonadota bacterium]